MNIINKVGIYKQAGREWYKRDVKDITTITIHHTASIFEGIHEEILNHLYKSHIAHDWVGLSYAYIMMPDGTIYKINDESEVTWHDTHNWDSIGIALHGYFHPEHNQKPTPEQLKSLKWLLDELCTQRPEFPADFDDVVAHRERSATACPGDTFFPKVVEYRTKLGNVNWELDSPLGITSEELWGTSILWDDQEGKRHEVSWYTREWFIEKTAAREFATENEGLTSQLKIANSKIQEKNSWYEDLMKSVGVMQNHVEAIQKSFSEFGHNQSLMSKLISTIQETVQALRMAFESSYEVWEKERGEKNMKITLMTKTVTLQDAEITSLTETLKSERGRVASEVATIPNKTIGKEFFKLLFGRR